MIADSVINKASLVQLESFNLKSLNLKLINSSVSYAAISSINRGGVEYHPGFGNNQVGSPPV